MARRVRLQMQAKKSKIPLAELCPKLVRQKSSPNTAVSSVPPHSSRTCRRPSFKVSVTVKASEPPVNNEASMYSGTDSDSNIVPGLEPISDDNADLDSVPDLVTDSDDEK